MRKILYALLFCTVASFAAADKPANPVPATSAQPVAESTAPAAPAAPAAAVAPADAAAPQEACAEAQAELAHRDSLMAIADSACTLEKDSLRTALNSEQAKSANWEQSYETMKKSNEACAKALGVSLGVNENSKEKRDEERREAAMMSGTSFLGGLGLGMLLFWLIFD